MYIFIINLVDSSNDHGISQTSTTTEVDNQPEDDTYDDNDLPQSITANPEPTTTNKPMEHDHSRPDLPKNGNKCK